MKIQFNVVYPRYRTDPTVIHYHFLHCPRQDLDTDLPGRIPEMQHGDHMPRGAGDCFGTLSGGAAM